MTRESMVGFRLSASARAERRTGPSRTTVSSTEIRVGVSPAADPAAVVRKRRDNRPMATRSRAAVSMSVAVRRGT